ncbi:MAG TPA: alpha/beta hydrolase [Ilumatobacter sp.]|nr:alpha/beta hydrolase [Ilumatobacter sp.]
MASIQANGITLEYEEQGEGRPLLLVMGLSGQLIDWPQGFVDMLADQGFRVIRFDNRDSGLSTLFEGVPPTLGEMAKLVLLRRKMRSEYVVSDMAGDAVGLLDVLGIARAHVVGVSMGGMIAQAMAIAHPERVLSLTSIMSTTGNRKVGRPKAKVIFRAARRGRATGEDDVIGNVIQQFTDISGPGFNPDEFRVSAEASLARSWRPDGTARQMAAILASDDRTDGLRGLTVPTLVIHGMVDPLVQPSGGIATAKAVPNARLLMFPDMGHDLPKARWHEMAVAIASNAARVQAISAPQV